MSVSNQEVAQIPGLSGARRHASSLPPGEVSSGADFFLSLSAGWIAMHNLNQGRIRVVFIVDNAYWGRVLVLFGSLREKKSKTNLSNSMACPAKSQARQEPLVSTFRTHVLGRPLHVSGRLLRA